MVDEATEPTWQDIIDAIPNAGEEGGTGESDDGAGDNDDAGDGAVTVEQVAAATAKETAKEVMAAQDAREADREAKDRRKAALEAWWGQANEQEKIIGEGLIDVSSDDALKKSIKMVEEKAAKFKPTGGKAGEWGTKVPGDETIPPPTSDEVLKNKLETDPTGKAALVHIVTEHPAAFGLKKREEEA